MVLAPGDGMMKVTRKILRRIIKEEMHRVSSRSKRSDLNEVFIQTIHKTFSPMRSRAIPEFAAAIKAGRETGSAEEVSRRQLWAIIQGDDQSSMSEAEIIDFQQARGLPWEFGPEGYSARGRGFERYLGHVSNDPEMRDRSMLAVALAVRAAEMLDPDGSGEAIEIEVDPAIFDELAKEVEEEVGRVIPGHPDTDEEDEAVTASMLVSMIDAGEAAGEAVYDEKISRYLYVNHGVTVPGLEHMSEPYQMDQEGDKWHAMARQSYDRDVEYMEILKDQCADGDEESCEELIEMQKMMGQDDMTKTKELAAQQPPEEVEQMGVDFERFLQGIESGDVIELPDKDD